MQLEAREGQIQVIVPLEEYKEFLKYKGQYESMKEAYETLLKMIENINHTSSYPHTKITYWPRKSHYEWTYGNNSGTHTSYKSEI